jgi:hypothetical protein
MARAMMLDGSIKDFNLDKDIKPVAGRYIFYRDRIYYAKKSIGIDKDYKLILERGDEEIVLTSEYVKAYARVVVDHNGLIEL